MRKFMRERICKEMRAAGIDCMFITPSSNMIYVLGSSLMRDERFSVLVLPADGEPFAFVNRVYQMEASAWEGVETVYWNDGEDPWSAFYAMCQAQKLAVGTIGIESTMPAGFLLAMMDYFKDSKLVDSSRIMRKLRPYKQEEERELMREACRRCSESLKETIGLGRYWIGKTEGEFSEYLCREMRKRGIDHSGALVCYGENGAIPHYLGNQSVIREGGGLLVDFGGTYGGYNSDMSRTFYFSGGEPEAFERFSSAYEVVLEANRAGYEAAVSGNAMEDVDRAARRMIERHGYGKYFTHRTGHGIGIDTHEAPNAEEGEKALIKPGMAFSIEPGIYIPGEFGIRIEDQALVTEEGTVLLHDFTRELVVI